MEKNPSRYDALISVLKKIQEKTNGKANAKESEDALKVAIVENIGSLTEVFMDLAITPQIADLALMSTEVKVLATGAKCALHLKSAELATNDSASSITALITDAEKSLQRYFTFKAAKLEGDAAGSKEDLLKLIKDNTPQ